MTQGNSKFVSMGEWTKSISLRSKNGSLKTGSTVLVLFVRKISGKLQRILRISLNTILKKDSRLVHSVDLFTLCCQSYVIAAEIHCWLMQSLQVLSTPKLIFLTRMSPNECQGVFGRSSSQFNNGSQHQPWFQFRARVSYD